MTRWRKSSVVILMISLLAYAAVDEIRFTPPTENEDGSVLLEQELDYYTYFCDGLEYVTFDSVIGNRTQTINTDGLAEGEHSCDLRVTALNGEISGPSNVMIIVVERPTPVTPPPVEYPSSDGGGGGLSWLFLIFLALAILVYIRGLRI